MPHFILLLRDQNYLLQYQLILVSPSSYLLHALVCPIKNRLVLYGCMPLPFRVAVT